MSFLRIISQFRLTIFLQQHKKRCVKVLNFVIIKMAMVLILFDFQYISLYNFIKKTIHLIYQYL
jgi:hypothetical protein